MGGAGRVGCYPGSFDPLTVAHLAIAEAAVAQAGLARLDLVVSRVALGKPGHASSLEARVDGLRHAAAARPWLEVVVTDAQLLVDVARGYDVLVVGADKWRQVLDPSFYGDSEAARDRAVAALPDVWCAPRAGCETPRDVHVLEVPAEVAHVSSTAVRSGAIEWLASEAGTGQTRQSPE